MSQLICFFQDYLSELSASEKRSMLREADLDVINTPSASLDSDRESTVIGRSYPDSPGSDSSTRVPRESYKALVEDLRRLYGRNAPAVLPALLLGGPETEPARNLSRRGLEAIAVLHRYGFESSNRRELPWGMASWAADRRNWYLVESPESPVTLQSRVWNKFPCLVFDNGPIECAAGDPALLLENLEDILQSTGVYDLWQHGNFGQRSSCVVLDTGADSYLEANGVQASAVGALSKTDNDGHGSAVIGLIRALCPQVSLESICVSQSFSGGQIWNLISGLTQLYQRQNTIVNLSLGVSLDWVRGLGPQATAFKESLSNVLASVAAQSNFPISAAGNDGLPDLRWPAAAPESLAVGSHNAAFTRSSFSNFRVGSPNLILAPGGEVRQLDSRVAGYGRYGDGLTRDVSGTSFSTAIASAVSCLLMGYGWFSGMQIKSRISLFRNHCRVNDQGFPILNVTDIGAVWPLRSADF